IACAAAVAASYLAAVNYVEGNRLGAIDAGAIPISEDEALYVEIPRGSGTGQIAEILAHERIIRHTAVFKLLSFVNGYDGSYKAGTHILKAGLSYGEIMSILCGEPALEISVWVVIAEHYTFRQTVGALVGKGIVDGDRFAEVCQSAEFGYWFIEGIPDREERLEGYLYPDSYLFDRNSDERAVARKFLSRFAEIYTDDLAERADAVGMTVDQVMTLASMIEREARVAGEKGTISSVFHNRLAAGMRLESCATVQYALYKRIGYVKEVITAVDTQVDDPYNTYLRDGLPPGPICSPGLESIEAALYPDSTGYLYFLAKNDGTGTHEFSETYEGHLDAVARYADDGIY
ncbi:MAG: endolytic transglycosylase MltG, partial [Oscillospiraceae bacterium]|nr:endolytic transglycosylase MltG [Oscillospiraceae bacterium]